jgi:hypothetical protein
MGKIFVINLRGVCNSMPPVFVDFPLRVVTPEFTSPLTDVVMDLEPLRRLPLL